MPRKLKTFVTNLGFFEMAIAAPSMKAALEAWGLGHNAFNHGFAKQTDDPNIVAATLAHPGQVLRRPVGTKGKFVENPSLPTDLPNLTPASPRVPKRARKEKTKAKAKSAQKQDKTAIISFEKERARREREREKNEAADRRASYARQRSIDKIHDDFEREKKRHEEELSAIEREQHTVDNRKGAEETRWRRARQKFDARLAEARGKD